MSKLISVFAYESEPIVVEGLHRVLESAEGFVFLGAAATPEEILETVATTTPDIILVSQSPGLAPDTRLAAELRLASPESRLVLWASDLNEQAFYLPLQFGFCGIIRKSRAVPLLVECLRAVGGGSFWVENPLAEAVPFLDQRRKPPRLTAREQEIARLVAGGLRNKEVAEQLSISPGTVKVHLMHIFEKMGVQDRFQLAMQLRRLSHAGHPGPEEPMPETVAQPE